MAEKIKIVFLGTASQVPTAKRNHTSILLTYMDENILIDCGEGTQRQFRIAKLNPCKITRILLTHTHGDHVLGIPGLFQTLALSGYNKTLFIYGPKGIKKFINNLLNTFQFSREYEIKVSEVSGRFFENKEFYIEATKVSHTTSCNAYSFVLKDRLRIDKKKLAELKLPTGPWIKELKEGKDITYNGKKYSAKKLTFLEKGKKISFVLDTAFFPEIVSFVKDADVLISESTFSSELQDKAKEFKHLTAIQAAEIAKKAKVKKLILTHISQRYEENSKLILEEAKKKFKNVLLARDFDVIKI